MPEAESFCQTFFLQLHSSMSGARQQSLKHFNCEGYELRTAQVPILDISIESRSRSVHKRGTMRASSNLMMGLSSKNVYQGRGQFTNCRPRVIARGAHRSHFISLYIK
jgi:hypothetical protein